MDKILDLDKPEEAKETVEVDTKKEELKDILYNKEEQKTQETENKEVIKEDAPIEPVKIERKDESLLSEDEFKDFEKFVTEHRLNQEQANLLLDREEKRKEQFDKNSSAHLEKVTQDWYNEIANDKEYGGSKLKETAEYARRALKEFGDDRLIQDLDKTGLGNHPSLVKMLSQIGRSMADDKLVRGIHAKPVRTKAEILYGE